MSPQGALAAVGLALVASGVALLIRAESRSLETTLRDARGTHSFEPTAVRGASPSTARLRRASFVMLIAGSGLLVTIAGAVFVWWFAIGTHGF